MEQESNKEQTSKGKKPISKKIAAIGAIVVVAAVAAGVWLFTQQNDTPTVAAREEVVTRGSIISSLTEESTASVATQTTALDLTVTLDDTTLDLDVKVEEILVRAGERVQQGDPLFIINQESLDKAMNTLNNAYQEAKLKADEAELNLKLGTLEAEQKRDESIGSGTTAGSVYANTVTEMETKLAQYEKSLRETEEDYEEYSELLDLYNLRTATRNNLKSTLTYYEDALEALQDLYNEYDEDNSDYKSLYQQYEKQVDSLVEQLEKAEANVENNKDSELAEQYGQAYDEVVYQFDHAIDIINKYQSVIDKYDTLENRIEDAEECIEEAKEAYNDYNEDYQDWYGNMSRSDLERKVNQLALDVENAKLTYENYKLNYDKNQASAESTKSKTELTAETADLTYEGTINKLQQQVLSTKQNASNLYDYVKELNRCLQDNVILSPCDGLITNIMFEEGDKIDLTRSVITVAQSDSLTVSLSIDQDDINNVKLDQQALVTFDTNARTYEGYVDAISISPAMMGSPTVTYTVTVLVEGEGLEDVYEGMSCTVDLVSERVDDVLVVPKRAITTQGGKSYVTVKQEDGSSVQQEVTLGFTDGSSYEVKEGLNEGDIILISSAIGGGSSNTGSAQSGGGMSGGQMPSGDMPNFEGGMPSGAPGTP